MSGPADPTVLLRVISARRFVSRATQKFIPRAFQRLAQSDRDLDGWIGGPRFDALNVGAIDLSKLAKLLLREPLTGS